MWVREAPGKAMRNLGQSDLMKRMDTHVKFAERMTAVAVGIYIWFLLGIIAIGIWG